MGDLARRRVFASETKHGEGHNKFPAWWSSVRDIGGKNLVRNFSELGALAAICDSELERCAEFSRQYPHCVVSESRAAIMADTTIQAVIIATPAESHGDLVSEALLAGKDVFVEKPLCLSLSTGKDLVALERERERTTADGRTSALVPSGNYQTQRTG